MANSFAVHQAGRQLNNLQGKMVLKDWLFLEEER